MRLCSRHSGHTSGSLTLRTTLELGRPSLSNMVCSQAPRQSISTVHSNNSTAFDLQSAEPSPRMTHECAGEGLWCTDPSPPSLHTVVRRCPLLDADRTERPETKDKRGWSLLAQTMSDIPEYAAFSRFKELNIKNLLYYQAELHLLQQEIALHEEKETTLNLKSYQKLVEKADSCYHQLLMKNRRLLREYSMWQRGDASLTMVTDIS